MADGLGPARARRRLRARLRDLREQRRLSTSRVAREMEWSDSKLTRIEAGAVSISANDLRALLHLYEVKEAEAVDELMVFARTARQRPWWSGFGLPPVYADRVGLEPEASLILDNGPNVVPGLCQTAAYARAVIQETTVDRLDEDEIAERVDIRVRRQGAVFAGVSPPQFVAVIDEAALRRTIGSAAVMREQLDHLVELNGRPQVTLVVMPAEGGGHPGLVGVFAVLAFDSAEDPDLVFVEAAGDYRQIDDEDTVGGYRRIFKRLQETGLRDDAAVKRLREIRDAHGD